MHFYLLVYSKGLESELTCNFRCVLFKKCIQWNYFTVPTTDSSNKQSTLAFKRKIGRNLKIP